MKLWSLDELTELVKNLFCVNEIKMLRKDAYYRLFQCGKMFVELSSGSDTIAHLKGHRHIEISKGDGTCCNCTIFVRPDHVSLYEQGIHNEREIPVCSLEDAVTEAARLLHW